MFYFLKIYLRNNSLKIFAGTDAFLFMHSLSGTNSIKSGLLFYNCVGCHWFRMIRFPGYLIIIKVYMQCILRQDKRRWAVLS